MWGLMRQHRRNSSSDFLGSYGGIDFRFGAKGGGVSRRMPAVGSVLGGARLTCYGASLRTGLDELLAASLSSGPSSPTVSRRKAE